MSLKPETLRGMGKRHPVEIAPTVIIKFADNPDSITDLMRIFSVSAQEGWLKFESESLIAAIIDSRRWESAQYREVRARFPLGIGLKKEECISILASARTIESIKFANQNPLNTLMTGRQKRQQEFAKEIISGCLTREVLSEAENWGLNISGSLYTTIEGLPGIRFAINSGKETVGEIILDGWSGSIMINGKLKCVSYHDNTQIVPILLCEINESVNRLTS